MLLVSQILDVGGLFTSEFSGNFKLFFDGKVRGGGGGGNLFLCQRSVVEFSGGMMASLEYSRTLSFGKRLVVFGVWCRGVCWGSPECSSVLCGGCRFS